MGSTSNAEWTETIERPINDRVSSLQSQLPNKKIQSWYYFVDGAVKLILIEIIFQLRR